MAQPLSSRSAEIQLFSGATRLDELAIEEPLEIRIHHGPLNRSERFVLTTTMRTPGQDLQLALGLMLAEGLHDWDNDLPKSRQTAKNELSLYLPHDSPVHPTRHLRTGFTSSACGVCGLRSMTHLLERQLPEPGSIVVSGELLLELPRRMRQKQRLFELTGGVHAISQFTPDGELLQVQEDVGRHNAFDKVVGSAILGGSGPLTDSIVVVSGRASFELIQKAAVAGLPIVMAVGAPSSLAVELAEKCGITLIGFAKSTEFNIYSHRYRVGDSRKRNA